MNDKENRQEQDEREWQAWLDSISERRGHVESAGSILHRLLPKLRERWEKQKSEMGENSDE